MNVLYYLLEANIYLCVFYAFYRLVLKRETFYTLNRFYLLISTVAAFLIPLVTVQQSSASAITSNTTVNAPVLLAANAVDQEAVVNTIPGLTETTHNTFNYLELLPIAYLVIATLFLALLTVSISRIVNLYRHSKRFKTQNTVHVLIEREQDAFSFFNWLFYHPGIQPNEAIIAHELVHIRQFHSIDILFFEVIRAFSWFNPINYLIIKDVKLNHEYLADEAASTQGIDPYSYARLLIDHAAQTPANKLVHAIFNGHQLTSRIEHLTKTRSTPAAKFKLFTILPIAGLLLLFSAFTVDKNYALFTISTKEATLPPIAKPMALKAGFQKKTAINTDSTISNAPTHHIKKVVTLKPIVPPTNTIDPSAKRTSIYIDARTDTVKIREIPTTKRVSAYPGIYAIGDKTYTDKELRSVLKQTGKADILFESRPSIGMYSENNAYAIEKWGPNAKKGVVFVEAHKDTSSIFNIQK